MSISTYIGGQREGEAAEMLDLWKQASYKAVPKPETSTFCGPYYDSERQGTAHYAKGSTGLLFNTRYYYEVG